MFMLSPSFPTIIFMYFIIFAMITGLHPCSRRSEGFAFTPRRFLATLMGLSANQVEMMITIIVMVVVMMMMVVMVMVMMMTAMAMMTMVAY